MKEKLNEIKIAALEKLNQVSDLQALESLRVEILGKKGELTQILKGMGSLSKEERPVIGQLANEVRSEIEAKLETVKTAFEEKAQEEKLKAETIDVTMPGNTHTLGHRHPMTQVIDNIKNIFIGMGYEVVEGPEVEDAYHNFEALNIPKDHPARDEQDATHSPIFHQLEGLVIDKGITMGDLKGALAEFAKGLFGEDTKVRFRPHHFPFTEPSAEMDASCFACGGKGCRVCKDSGWIEVLGCGMVHPDVLRRCGIDPNVYSGFAFGMGLERVAMQKYSINDLRLLFENDVRFLKQF